MSMRERSLRELFGTYGIKPEFQQTNNSVEILIELPQPEIMPPPTIGCDLEECKGSMRLASRDWTNPLDRTGVRLFLQGS